MKEREAIPKAFTAAFDGAEILAPRERKSWSDIIRRSVETNGYKVVTWKEVGEGAIATVLANENCVDPIAIIIGSNPGDIENWRTEPAFKYWSQIWEDNNFFPGLLAYCQWGTSLANKNNKWINRYGHWVELAENFISELRKKSFEEFNNTP